MKVGDEVKVIHDGFHAEEKGVVLRSNVWNDKLKVNVILVRIDGKDSWFTSYQLVVIK